MRKSTIALLCALGLLSSVSGSCAGPIQSELRSYRCLVPDWSKTSGGVSPALSPDGKTLVYIVRQSGDFLNDQVWAVSGLDEYNPGDKYSSQPTKLPEPWQIKYSEPRSIDDLNTSVWDGSSGLQSDFRNVDWSPNGKSVAFICHGKLFIAEDLDPKTKSAKVRLIADIGMVPKESMPDSGPADHKYAEPVIVPRWSPDGTLIAYLRPSPPPGVANQVCMVNVNTGEETVLARDAVNDGSIWEQPWSPDSRNLAYSRLCPVNGGQGGVMDGISIVSVTGGAPRKPVSGKMANSPSWSPKGDKLAYSGPSERSGFGGMIPMMYTCSIDGNNQMLIAKTTPAPAALVAAQTQVRDRLQNVLKRSYPDAFSAAEIKELTSGKISDSDVIAIIMIAEGWKAAKEIGGDFQRKVDAALKRWPRTGKHKLDACVDISNAVSALPDDKHRAFQDKSFNVISEITQPLMNLKSVMDIVPVWSPDGHNLAFTRWDIAAGYMRLIIVNVLTSKTKTVFESNVIGNITWRPDSRSLILSAKRNLAYKGKSSSPGDLWPELITMPSYPEIWVIDLK